MESRILLNNFNLCKKGPFLRPGKYWKLFSLGSLSFKRIITSADFPKAALDWRCRALKLERNTLLDIAGIKVRSLDFLLIVFRDTLGVQNLIFWGIILILVRLLSHFLASLSYLNNIQHSIIHFNHISL